MKARRSIAGAVTVALLASALSLVGGAVFADDMTPGATVATQGAAVLAVLADPADVVDDMWDVADDDVVSDGEPVDPVTGLTETEQAEVDDITAAKLAECEAASDDVDDDACTESVAALVHRKHQSIRMGRLPDLPVGDMAPVDATASSGLPVLLEARGACTMNGSSVVPTEAGLCSIWATQPGDDKWFPAEPVSDVMRTYIAPVDLGVSIDGITEVSGTHAIKRGAMLLATVIAANTANASRPPRGQVSIAFDAQTVKTADLDSSGQAVVAFNAPSRSGRATLTVTYSGANGAEPVLWSRTVRVLRNLSSSGAGIEVLTDPADGRIVDGQSIDFTATLFPSPEEGTVKFKWDDQLRATVTPVKTSEGWVATYSTDDLGWGTHEVRVVYEGRSEGRSFTDTDTVQVVVDKDENNVSVKASSASSGDSVIPSSALTTTLAKAPQVRIFAGAPTSLTVSLPGVPNGKSVLVRVRDDRGYSTLGRTTVTGRTAVLPMLVSSTTGSFTVRVVPENGDPHYLRVRVTSAPATSGKPPAWDWVQVGVGFGAELAKELIKSAFKSFGAEVVGGPLGWVAAKAINLAYTPAPEPNTKDAELRAYIQQELADTNALVKQVKDNTEDLEGSLAKSSCGTQLGFANDALSKIEGYELGYQDLTNALKGAGTGAGVKVSAEWLTWANKVLESSDDARTLVKAVDGALMGRGDASSSALAACASSYLVDWRMAARNGAPGAELGEAAYYKRLFKLRDYVQDIEGRALNLWVEAAHLKAMDAWLRLIPNEGTIKPDLAADEIDQICSMDLSGYRDPETVTLACGYARSFTSQMYDILAKQMIATGAGYSLNPTLAGVASSSASSPDLLWLTDVNMLGDRPTSSRSPNGIFGTTDELDMPWNSKNGFAWAGYRGWRAATSADWRPMLVDDGTGRMAADLLASRGFFRNTAAPDRKMLIYTGESLSVPAQPEWRIPDPEGYSLSTKLSSWLYDPQASGLCFIDTSSTTGESGLTAGRTMPFCLPGETTLPNGVRTRNAELTALYTRFSKNWLKSYAYQGENHATEFLLRSAASASNTDFYGSLRGSTLITRILGSRMWMGSDWTSVFRTSGKGMSKFKVVEQAPSWVDSPKTNTTATTQRRWPVLDLTKVPCSDGVNLIGAGGFGRTYAPPRDSSGAPGKNIAGVRSMCGADFEQWLMSVMGTPPVVR